jgi:predicted GNAT family N-acyltransferase
MNLLQVAHGSETYWTAVQLRREVLRYPLGLDYTDEQLQAESNEHHFVAECGGEIFAYAMATVRPQHVIQIRQVAVRQDLQGQGIGSKIMDCAEEWAATEGFTSCLLHARGYAIPFYEKIGYTAYGDEFVEVGIPHRKMTKPLSVSK